MKQINLLCQTLKPLLGWHGARLNFLASSPHCPIESENNMALMSLAMCWAMKVGEWLHSHTPLKVRFPMRGFPALGSHLKVKKHGRREKSLFCYGFDHLRSIVNDLDIKHRQFLECLQFLSCT